MNLREKHGYTYGASSAFDMRAAPGPFAAAAGVQTDKTAEALKEFFNELNAILQPVPADELARAKNYVALRFPSGFETTSDISRRLEDVLVYHLPDDYFSKYVANIEAVTAADVQRVADEVHPARSLRRRRRRRPEGDRAGHPRAQSRRDQAARASTTCSDQPRRCSDSPSGQVLSEHAAAAESVRFGNRRDQRPP